MRERRENPMMRAGEEEETGRLTVHKTRENKIYMERENREITDRERERERHLRQAL